MNLQESIKRILREDKYDDKVGRIFWFEYHCYESPESCDSEIWYRSHQKVKVIGVSEWSFDDYEDRMNDGQPRVYLVEWKDGFQYDVFEDELLESPNEFYRPNPPKRKIQESIRRILLEENKKSGLLRAIEEDGLFQVMQDTGLSMGQIILKYDNLPREVFERYIKDFIKHDGYHQTDGSVQLGYEVEIQTHVYTEHFYMKGDRVTVEIRRFDNRGQQTEGYIESLSNLTDDEIFNIVDDMTSWGGDIDYKI